MAFNGCAGNSWRSFGILDTRRRKKLHAKAGPRGFEHLNPATPDPVLRPKLEFASRYLSETKQASSKQKLLKCAGFRDVLESDYRTPRS